MAQWITTVQAQLRQFADERDWHQYHTVPNLIQSVAIEAGELLELTQWGEAPIGVRLEEEIADVQIYLLRLADIAGIDLAAAVDRKIELNRWKYPL